MTASWNTAVELEPEPERYELFEDHGYRFDLDRRGFLKSLGGGILVLHLLNAAHAEQQPRGRRGITCAGPFVRASVRAGQEQRGVRAPDFATAYVQEAAPEFERAGGRRTQVRMRQRARQVATVRTAGLALPKAMARSVPR